MGGKPVPFTDRPAGVRVTDEFVLKMLTGLGTVGRLVEAPEVFWRNSWLFAAFMFRDCGGRTSAASIGPNGTPSGDWKLLAIPRRAMI